MNKDRFIELVHNYSSNLEEINSLKILVKEYPFSQIIHLLLANAIKKDNNREYKIILNNAAFHSTDRSILKSLIENNLVPSEAITSAKKINPIKTIPEALTETNNAFVITSTDSDAFIDGLVENLNELQKIKKEFSDLFLEPVEIPETQKPNLKKIAPSAIESLKKDVVKSSKTLTPPKHDTLIEKFIEEEPSISKNTPSISLVDDLAKNSGQLREDIISESLAKIFVVQGKTEKAIDIYKKLIWKHPQKKSLFAAEIEKLKKN